VRIAAFDLSRAMIDYASAQVRSADSGMYRLAVADMRTVDTGQFAPGWRFELAFSTINTIRHLETDAHLLEHLGRIHDALRPGGVYVVGLSLSVYGFEQPSEDTWAGARGSLRVTQVVQFTPARGGRDRMEQVNNVLAVTRPGGTGIIPSAYRLRSYDRQQWEAVLARSPFSIWGCVDEAGGDMRPTSPGYALWVLKRDR
jgi:SAM-dependent methyltransferase